MYRTTSRYCSVIEMWWSRKNECYFWNTWQNAIQKFASPHPNDDWRNSVSYWLGEVFRLSLYNKNFRKHLEETIIRHEVDHLAIMTKTFSPAKPGCKFPIKKYFWSTISEIFLLLVSNLVRSLHICQQYDNWILKEDLYLWGSQNVDWAPIIVEMFKRKINKLLVENYHFPKYLSSNSVDFLREVSVAS